MRNLLFFLLFFSIGSLQAQGWEYSSEELNTCLGAIELSNGDYLLANANVHYYNEVDEFSDFFRLIVLSSLGDAKDSLIINFPEYACRIIGLFSLTDTSFMVVGRLEAVDTKIWVGQYTNDLSLLQQNMYNFDIPDIHYLFTEYTKPQSEINFVGAADSDWKDIVGKIDITQNAISYVLLNESHTPFDIIPRPDSIGYVVNATLSFLLIDDSLNIVNVISKISDGEEGAIHWQGQFEDGFDEKTFIVSGKWEVTLVGWDSVAFAIQERRIIDYSEIKTLVFYPSVPNAPNKWVYPAAYQSMSKNITNKTLFVGGTAGVAQFQVDTTRFILVKLDESLHVLWEKDYGEEGVYQVLYGVLATSDGGCLMYGYRHYFELGFTANYALKVDENGIVTGETTIPLPKDLISVYPNPTHSTIQFDLPEGLSVADMELVDINGRIVLTQKISHEPVDVSFLPKGMYVYRVKDENGELMGVGKVVVE